MGSQDNRKAKNSIDRISNTISGDGRKFVGELKTALNGFYSEVGDIVKDVVTDIGEGSAEQLTGLSLTEVHVTGKNGAPQSNIQVDFSNANVTNYKEAQVWMKTGSADFAQVGVTNGLRYIIEDAKAGTTYTIKVVAVNKSGGTAAFDEAPRRNITIKGSVLTPDAPKQFYLTWDADGALWEWLYEDNGYVDFFELRLDENAGSYDEYLLDRTRNTFSRVAPPSRSGVGYLFVRNVFGQYSQPTIHVFSKAVPLKPNAPVIESTLDGVVITMDALPSNYQGWKLEINGEEFKAYSRRFTYYQFSGIVTVKYSFYDYIGQSEWSDAVSVNIKTVLDKDQLPTISKDDLPEIGYEEFDQAVKDAINAANNQAGINKDLQGDIDDVKENLTITTDNINQSIEDARSEISQAKDELSQSIGNLSTEIGSVRDEINQSVSGLNSDISGIRTSIQGISQSVDNVALGVQQNADSITSLYASAEEMDGRITSNASLIQQTANSIETTVTEKVAVAKGEVVREVLDEIDDDLIAEVQKEVGSQVTQEAEKITATVYEMVKDEVSAEAIAQVQIEADKLKATVYTKTETDASLAAKADKDTVYTKEETASQITQSADEIKALVSSSTTTLEGKINANTSAITQTDTAIRAMVSEEVGVLDGKIAQNTSAITQTATSIRSEIDSEVADLNDKISQNTSAITQTSDEITALVNKKVSELDGKIANNTSAITQTAEEITAMVDEQVEELDGKISANSSAITQTAADIRSLVSSEVSALDVKINTNTSLISQTSSNIQSMVNAKVEELNGKIEENTSTISQTAEEITSLVHTEIASAEGRMSEDAASKVSQSATEIKSLINKEVTSLNGKISSNTSAINQTATDIRSLVNSKVEELDGKITENASAITQSANAIKSTVYTKTEVNGLLSNKANTSDVYTKTETASQITQSANDIKTLVSSELETLDDKIASNASAITQNANSITSLTTSVSNIDGRVSQNTANIKQNADNITAAVSRIDTVEDNVEQNTASINLTNNSITSVVSKLNGKAENSGYTALTGLASSVVQTNNSITSVVTELNKSPNECKYSSITQLQDGIDLCVKDADLNGEEVVSRINLSDGTVTIDGKYVHITGDTMFDNDVIVGGNIVSDSITTDHLKMNAVTTAKIAANAITADKIKAGSITTEKVTDRSITSVKIEDGAITTTKLIDGAVSSTKIEGGAITTEHIQAGSIIGEHISAGAVSADKLFAGNIDMTGALALVGGAVKLDENGLTCQMNDGYTVFDEEGITFFNNSGESFAQVRQMCIGTAEHGSTVRFAGTWSEVPSVVCVPTELQIGVGSYTQSDVFMVCGAKNVTKDGFSVQCYTKLGEGASASINFDQEYLFPNDKETIITIGTYNATEASTLSITVSVSSYANTTGDPGLGKDAWYSYKWWSTGHFEFYNDGVLIGSTVPPAILSYPNIASQHTGTVSNINTVITTVDCVVDGVGELTAKFIPERSKYANTQDLSTILRSIEYNTEGEHIISTGRALFVAMTNSATGYTVTKGGATYGLRNEVRQG